MCVFIYIYLYVFVCGTPELAMKMAAVCKETVEKTRQSLGVSHPQALFPECLNEHMNNDKFTDNPNMV